MTIYEVAQVQAIMGNAEVEALVGDRIYPEVLPGNPSLPAVTYQLISSPRNMTQQGASAVRPRYRWNCFALTYDEAVAVATTIAKASNSFAGWVDNESDNHESDTGLFRRRIETLAWADPPEVP